MNQDYELTSRKGSGTLGSVVLKILLDSPYDTTVLSRQQSSSQFPEGVRVIRTDYDDPESLESAMQGQDVVISTIGVPRQGIRTDSSTLLSRLA